MEKWTKSAVFLPENLSAVFRLHRYGFFIGVAAEVLTAVWLLVLERN